MLNDLLIRFIGVDTGVDMMSVMRSRNGTKWVLYTQCNVFILEAKRLIKSLCRRPYIGYC